MLFDPEAGKTIEESFDIALRKMKPERRAQLEHLAQVSGHSEHELMAESIEIWASMMKDPAKRAAWNAKLDRREAPLGFDPLVRKDR